MMAFSNQLGAYHNLVFSIPESKHRIKTFLPVKRIRIKAQNAVIRKKPVQFLLHQLGANSGSAQPASVTSRTLRRLVFPVTAVMAVKFAGGVMIHERNRAFRAGKKVTAVFAEKIGGMTAAVDKNNRLLSLQQPFLQQSAQS